MLSIFATGFSVITSTGVARGMTMVAESVLLADTVWIVDDSPDYRRLLAMIQARWQYRVIAAQESEQVLTCLASHRMHIVTMPLMEGAALC